MQTYSKDTPTYKDVLQSTNEERALWDAATTKELKSLRDLGAFKMVPRQRGSNMLQSTWAFKKKRYPDSLLKKFKAMFLVRGDQQVDGTYELVHFPV